MLHRARSSARRRRSGNRDAIGRGRNARDRNNRARAHRARTARGATADRGSPNLGFLDRPWHHAQFGRGGRVLGYYDLERYVPDQWRPGYPNAAYERMTEHDAAWMARIVAPLRDAHLHAIVARARFSDPTATDELFRILKGRRDRLLERWLTRLSPLTHARVEGDRICVE